MKHYKIYKEFYLLAEHIDICGQTCPGYEATVLNGFLELPNFNTVSPEPMFMINSSKPTDVTVRHLIFNTTAKALGTSWQNPVIKQDLDSAAPIHLYAFDSTFNGHLDGFKNDFTPHYVIDLLLSDGIIYTNLIIEYIPLFSFCNETVNHNGHYPDFRVQHVFYNNGNQAAIDDPKTAEELEDILTDADYNTYYSDVAYYLNNKVYGPFQRFNHTGNTSIHVQYSTFSNLQFDKGLIFADHPDVYSSITFVFNNVHNFFTGNSGRSGAIVYVPGFANWIDIRHNDISTIDGAIFHFNVSRSKSKTELKETEFGYMRISNNNIFNIYDKGNRTYPAQAIRIVDDQFDTFTKRTTQIVDFYNNSIESASFVNGILFINLTYTVLNAAVDNNNFTGNEVVLSNIYAQSFVDDNEYANGFSMTGNTFSKLRGCASSAAFINFRQLNSYVVSHNNVVKQNELGDITIFSNRCKYYDWKRYEDIFGKTPYLDYSSPIIYRSKYLNVSSDSFEDNHCRQSSKQAYGAIYALNYHSVDMDYSTTVNGTKSNNQMIFVKQQANSRGIYGGLFNTKTPSQYWTNNHVNSPLTHNCKDIRVSSYAFDDTADPFKPDYVCLYKQS